MNIAIDEVDIIIELLHYWRLIVVTNLINFATIDI